jgi:EAL domain-containing protein (putative c-di-GMP-specific phosphodiesterase class I)
LLTADLIRQAEDAGLICDITDFVLETALEQLRAWRDAGLAEGIRLALNVSGLEVMAGDNALARMVTRRLAAATLPAWAVEFEITESTIMRPGAGTTAVLSELKALGVRLAVDDFGVGYSSLSRLQRMPVDAVKMDRSFVQGITDPGGGALVRAIVNMAHSLQLSVTAEGVETQEQLVFLQDVGCDTLQGFLLGRPAPAPEITAWLQAHHRDGAAQHA